MIVEVLDVYGSDMKISKYAGISYGKDNESRNRLAKIIKQGHESPFRLGGLVLKCQLPLFVFRQIQRTEVGRDFLEKSFRYVKADESKFYISDFPDEIRDILIQQYRESVSTYTKLLEYEEIKPEFARMVLPQAIYIELIGYWSLSALMRLYKSRTLNKHAQQETRKFVSLMWDALKEHFPLIAEEFDKNNQEEWYK
ncbi:MAG: FAD-dependent thymidylate synthase [Thermotogota bacterium]